MEKKHIQNIEETDEAVTITFGKGEIKSEKSKEEKKELPKVENKDLGTQSKKYFRTFNIKQDNINEIERKVDLSFSSETPYERNFGMEIIDHNRMDLSFLGSGNAPLLADHDPTKQIGIIEKVDVADARGRAVVRFGKSDLADSFFQDVQDGIRQNVSFGYEILDMVRLKSEDDDEEDKPSYRVATKPLEISLVSIPADTTVGVNRAKENKLTNIEVIKETKIMDKKEENNVQAKPENTEAMKQEVRKNESERIREIYAVAEKHNVKDLADKHIQLGSSVAEFKGVVLESKSFEKPLDTPVDEVGLNQKEQQEYSLARMINAQISRDFSKAGYEKELSDEIARKSNKSAQGFFVPAEVWTRDRTVGTDNAGGYLRPNVHRGDLFIDVLREASVVGQLGATQLNGLSGKIEIPTLAGGSSAAFVAENSAVAENDPTFGQKTMIARTLGGFVDVSRHLLAQSSPSVDTILRNDMINAIANKIDDVALEGGGSNEPTGIIGSSPNVIAMGTNGGAITYAKTLDCITQVAVDKGLSGSLGYVTTPQVVGAMRTTAKVSSTDSVMIMNDASTLNGYRILQSNNVPSDLTKGSTSGSCHALFFGNFAELMIGYFSGIDVVVDPYTGSSAGTTRIVFLQDMDVAVRHGESFGIIKDITV